MSFPTRDVGGRSNFELLLRNKRLDTTIKIVSLIVVFLHDHLFVKLDISLSSRPLLHISFDNVSIR